MLRTISLVRLGRQGLKQGAAVVEVGQGGLQQCPGFILTDRRRAGEIHESGHDAGYIDVACHAC